MVEDDKTEEGRVLRHVMDTGHFDEIRKKVGLT